MLGAHAERLGALLPGHVARLVGVPYLLAVVAELRLAAVPLTGQLGAAGAAIGNNSIAGEEDVEGQRTAAVPSTALRPSVLPRCHKALTAAPPCALTRSRCPVLCLAPQGLKLRAANWVTWGSFLYTDSLQY